MKLIEAEEKISFQGKQIKDLADVLGTHNVDTNQFFRNMRE
jgi:hypothetical protein